MRVNPVLAAILVALPFGYVAPMKATQQSVEWVVVLMMLPFMAFPFVAGLILSRQGVDGETNVRQIVPTLPRPRRQESHAAKLGGSVLLLVLGTACGCGAEMRVVVAFR